MRTVVYLLELLRCKVGSHIRTLGSIIGVDVAKWPLKRVVARCGRRRTDDQVSSNRGVQCLPLLCRGPAAVSGEAFAVIVGPVP